MRPARPTRCLQISSWGSRSEEVSKAAAPLGAWTADSEKKASGPKAPYSSLHPCLLVGAGLVDGLVSDLAFAHRTLALIPVVKPSTVAFDVSDVEIKIRHH